MKKKKIDQRDESKYVGKHRGSCEKCGFSLITDQDEKCPRCGAKVNK